MLQMLKFKDTIPSNYRIYPPRIKKKNNNHIVEMIVKKKNHGHKITVMNKSSIGLLKGNQDARTGKMH